MSDPVYIVITALPGGGEDVELFDKRPMFELTAGQRMYLGRLNGGDASLVSSGEAAFVLDLATNPHPKMLDAAIRHRRIAKLSKDPSLGLRWLTYLEAMADATGKTLAEIDEWVGRQDDFDPSTIGTSPPSPLPSIGRRSRVTPV